MTKNIFITLVCFLLSFQINAQVNVEKYNDVSDKIGSSGNISIYLSSKTGNTDVQQFGADGRFNYSGKNFYTFLVGKGEYGWNKGKEFSNNALLHLRYIRNLNATINPEVFGQIDYNKKRLLLFRSLVGGGIRIALVKDSLSNLVFGTSYMFEHESLKLNDISTHASLTNYHRWNNYLSYSNDFSKNARLSIVVYAQPRFSDFNDLKILSENHLGVVLTKKFSLSINFALMYDSKPPDGIKNLDTNTKVGFTVKL
ncbi:MAG: DUF481 domain-containing protein [Flavobacteriaceae bacterium]